MVENDFIVRLLVVLFAVVLDMWTVISIARLIRVDEWMRCLMDKFPYIGNLLVLSKIRILVVGEYTSESSFPSDGHMKI